MNDQKLLELACKAYSSAMRWDVSKNWPVDGNGILMGWNPLRDDGDALRLAATLKIDIEWQFTQVGARPDVEAYISDPDGSCFCASESEDNYRRAIVCAAANLGESMP